MDYGLALRKDKCKFGVHLVTWFGLVFSVKDMSLDPEKMQIIQDWPVL